MEVGYSKRRLKIILNVGRTYRSASPGNGGNGVVKGRRRTKRKLYDQEVFLALRWSGADPFNKQKRGKCGLRAPLL